MHIFFHMCLRHGHKARASGSVLWDVCGYSLSAKLEDFSGHILCDSLHTTNLTGLIKWYLSPGMGRTGQHLSLWCKLPISLVIRILENIQKYPHALAATRPWGAHGGPSCCCHCELVILGTWSWRDSRLQFLFLPFGDLCGLRHARLQLCHL